MQGLWTPAINYRIGRSGCQPNCIACGQVCPTAAIRPLSLEEKLGRGDFAAQGPIRMGTAFVDRGRCLPWALDRPCLVCHELCPVSPKAIFVRTVFETIRDGQELPAQGPEAGRGPGRGLSRPAPTWPAATTILRPAGQPETALRRIIGLSGNRLTLESPLAVDGLPAYGGQGGYRGALVASLRGCRQVYRLRHVRA